MGQSLFCGTQGAQPGAHLGSLCLGALSTSCCVRTTREKARKVCDGWALTIVPLGASILPGVALPEQAQDILHPTSTLPGPLSLRHPNNTPTPFLS